MNGDNQVVISHGNGPQVGQINLGMNYAAEHGKTAAFPFPECGAMSQGYIGYHLQQSLQNEIHHRGMQKNVVTAITQIAVDNKLTKLLAKRVILLWKMLGAAIVK